jgi:malonate transporter and related proteins
MADILNLALPYFGPIFIGFACGKANGLPETGPASMKFLPAAVFFAGVAVRHHVEDAVFNLPLMVASAFGIKCRAGFRSKSLGTPP